MDENIVLQHNREGLKINEKKKETKKYKDKNTKKMYNKINQKNNYN